MNHIHLECVCKATTDALLAQYQYQYLLMCSRFKNRPHMTFDDVGLLPDQEFELSINQTGTTEFATK